MTFRILAVLALLAFAAGCGSSDPAAEPGSGAVSIEHKFGTTEIPADPERVVTIGFSEQDTVLALGVVPVGEREFTGGYKYRERPWAQEALNGEQPASVGAEEINFERVAAQRPDVIIGVNSGMTKDEYDRLSRIAPTVAQSDEHIDFGVPWQEQALTVGKALGREAEAQQLVDDVEAQFAQAREEHPEFDTSFLMAYGGKGEFGAHASGDYRVGFFTDLGFKSAPKIDELAGDSFFIDLDEEQFRLLDQDVVVMFGERDEVEQDPVLGRLPAFREGRVVYLDLTDQIAGALGFASPLSLPYLLDEAVPKLAAAADGDPSTTEPDPE